MTPVSTERLEAKAIELATAANMVWDELEDHGSDGENRTTYRRLAALSLRGDGELVERLSAQAADDIADAVMGNDHLDHCLDTQQRDDVHSDIQIEAVRVVSTLLSTQGKRLAVLEADRQAAHETNRALHRRVQQAESSINIRRQVLAEAKATGNGYADGFCRLYDERQSLIARAEAAESALSTAEARALETAAAAVSGLNDSSSCDPMTFDQIAAFIRALSANEAGK